jgi:hypothetical protein
LPAALTRSGRDVEGELGIQNRCRCEFNCGERARQRTRRNDTTVAYLKDRQVFGKPVSQFQNTKFELAAVDTEVEAGQAMIDRALGL